MIEAKQVSVCVYTQVLNNVIENIQYMVLQQQTLLICAQVLLSTELVRNICSRGLTLHLAAEHLHHKRK